MIVYLHSPDDSGDDARAVLASLLADGPLWVEQAFDKMTEAGFTRDQTKRAKQKLKIRSDKFGSPGDEDQGWKWVLPEGSKVAYGGVFYPLIVCDRCEQRITDTGNVYWLVYEDGSIHPQIWHTHKACHEFEHTIKAQHGGLHVNFEELDVWLDQIRKNFRWDQ